jgi:hypothetical protein
MGLSPLSGGLRRPRCALRPAAAQVSSEPTRPRHRVGPKRPDPKGRSVVRRHVTALLFSLGRHLNERSQEPAFGYADAFSGPDARLPSPASQIPGRLRWSSTKEARHGLVVSLFCVGAGAILTGVLDESASTITATALGATPHGCRRDWHRAVDGVLERGRCARSGSWSVCYHCGVRRLPTAGAPCPGDVGALP